MKVWITKYALTDGIIERDVEICHEVSSTMAEVKNNPYGEYYYKPHWHESREEAIARAEQMRLRKIASLEKQIAKLRELRFE